MYRFQELNVPRLCKCGSVNRRPNTENAHWICVTICGYWKLPEIFINLKSSQTKQTIIKLNSPTHIYLIQHSIQTLANTISG